MWSFVVVFSMVAAMGAMVVAQEAHNPSLEHAQAGSRANNLALYRSLVVLYAASHPGETGTVADSALLLPPWYRRDPAWAHQILPGSRVIVYAQGSVPPTLASELVELSQGSMLAGEARTRADGSSFLYSPRFGDTGIPLPPLASGTVVWPAQIN
jgi:hypothetical protein